MGFEGRLYYGVKGTTAATEITQSRDITYGLSTTKGETTVRGSGSGPPVMTERVTVREITINFQMINKSSDTTLDALLTAAYAGTAVAIRTKDNAAGLGFDGDCNLEVSHGKPYKGEQTFDFTCTPNDDDRDPLLYV